MSFERARRPEQKEQRRAAIVEAASALLEERSLSDISLSEIARRSGVSKANVYRYFENREAIFLELLLARTNAMIAAFEAAMAPLAGGGDPHAVADAITKTLVAHPGFVRLFAVVSSVIEKNVSADAIRVFKRELSFAILRPVNALHAALPALSFIDTRRLLTHVLVHTSGLWSAAHPAPHVAEVLEEPEFEALKVEYAEALREHTRLLLDGLLFGGRARTS